ncbi:MAG TPA: hypothetical protein VK911_16155 [Vicinamibacterales bacterium]|nr:hypothetical protein [Vicinamibacterales bacterium]
MKTRFSSRVVCSAFLLLVCFAAPPAFAQAGGGVRGGVSADPDQFYFGAHLDTGPLVEMLTFRPNLEVGLGDNLTTIAANFEFVYWIPLRTAPWSLYAGGGPALNIYRWDAGRNDRTETEPGFNFLIGIQHRRGLFTEFKLGVIDSPELKFGIGYSF